jgi:outer membrane biosynthesis protein TonB
LGASAAVLLLGVSAVAIAQSGGDVRSNDRKTEKALDHEKLTPIRPIRRVGPEDWPAGDPSKRADDSNKPKETTGQAAQNPKQDQAKQQAAPAKQDQAKQEPAKQQPAQQPAKETTAQQDQPRPAAQSSEQAQSGNQQQPSGQSQQSQQSSTPAQQQKQENFASTRLGTDAQGKVAINQAQEKQIVTALKRQRIRSTDVSVKLGAIAPPNVRLGAVSADIVAVLPQFRGYSFFTTGDELVIVEPTDKKVVALVPLNTTQTASRPERDRSSDSSERTDRSSERAERSERSSERTERSVSRSSSRRESKRETVGADIPSEEEILNAPVVRSGRAATRIEPDDGTVVIERRHHRPRVLGIFRF